MSTLLLFFFLLVPSCIVCFFLCVQVRRNNISSSSAGGDNTEVGLVNSACIKLPSGARPGEFVAPLLLGVVYQNNAVENARASLLLGPSAAFTTVMCMQGQARLPVELQSSALCPSYDLQAQNTALRIDRLCAADSWKFDAADAPKKKSGVCVCLCLLSVFLSHIAHIWILHRGCFEPVGIDFGDCGRGGGHRPRPGGVLWCA